MNNNLLVEYNKGRLYNHPHANCRLEVQGNFVVFVSYETPILFFKRDTQEICVKFDKFGRFYSRTTARQVTWALNELTYCHLSSQDMYTALKAAYKAHNLSKGDYLERNNQCITIRVNHEWTY